MRGIAAALVSAGLVASVALTGCSESNSGDQTLTVFAASSLSEVFTQLGTEFEQAHPGTHIVFNFAGSDSLAVGINNGAPADVFAPASNPTMDQVVSAGHALDPQPFATNTMQIATPPSNPAGIKNVSDLASGSVSVALCQPNVPCGALALEVLGKSGVSVEPVTLEPDVRSVLTKVELGQVDAGIVYVTDVRDGGARISGVSIPAAQNATTSYPIAAIAGTENLAMADEFVTFVESAQGQAVLAEAGFGPPGTAR